MMNDRPSKLNASRACGVAITKHYYCLTCVYVWFHIRFYTTKPFP